VSTCKTEKMVTPEPNHWITLSLKDLQLRLICIVCVGRQKSEGKWAKGDFFAPQWFEALNRVV
jgi:hypothetical protein